MSSFIEKIKSALSFSAYSKTKALASYERLFPDASEKRLTYKLHKAPVYRIDASLEAYNAAISEAENIYRPRRVLLQQLYKQVMRDNHLNSGVRKRQNMLLSQKFSINTPQGKPQPEKTKLLERLWFFRLQEIFVETEFYGHSLIELGKQNEQGEFTEIYLVPRELVIPDIACVLSDALSETPISYKSKGLLLDYLIELGESNDLGLLENITPKIIMKKYALSDWSRHSERFGMPTVHIKTNTNDRKQLDAYEDMGANLGSSGYIITDSDTEVINLEASKQDAYRIYQEMVNLCNAEISKAISGETGTTEEKAFVGSAEVHERILNELGDTDSLYFKYFVNYTLLPMLRRYGYPFVEGDYFDWQRSVAPKSQASQPPKSPSAPEGGETANSDKVKTLKKKSELNPSISPPLRGLGGLTKRPSLKSLGDLIENLIESLFNGSLKKGDLDPAYQSYFEKEMQKATTEGYGLDFFELEPDSLHYDTLQKIYNFQNSFVAHKNYKFISELADALRDENGEIKPFRQFKEEAMKIHATWNEQWLKSEYNLAVTGATMARQWQELQADKELFPNLQFKTAFDDNVRDAHSKLHNVIRPIDDDFWKTHYPPLGWGCRCTVLQRTAEATITSNEVLAGLPAPDTGFDTNVGITGQVFNPQKNPYYKNISQADKDKIEIYARKILPTSGVEPFDFALNHLDKIAQVNIDESTNKLLKEWLGEDYHKIDVLNLAGGFASDNLTINKLSINQDGDKQAVLIEIETDKYSLKRRLLNDENGLAIKNLSMKTIKNKEDLGTKLFANQILTALKLKINRFEADATKSKTQNGYYTLAVWGFDFANKSDLDRLNRILRLLEEKPVNSLRELFTRKNVKSIWNQDNGFNFEAVFELSNPFTQYFMEYSKSKFNKSNEEKEENPHTTKEYTPEAGSFEEPNIEEIDDIDWEAFRKGITKVLKNNGLM